MDATDIVDAVESDLQTELSRLGSSKSLYADTEGELEPDRVLGAIADGAHHAADTFRGWAADADPFADAADRLADQYETLEGELGGHEPGDEPAVVAALADAEGESERLGALVGWSLVAERKASQATGFFTGQADPGTASTLRAFGEDFEAIREAALEALADRDGDGEVAAEAANAVVQAAYDAYFETLEDLGVNPKPVC